VAQWCENRLQEWYLSGNVSHVVVVNVTVTSVVVLLSVLLVAVLVSVVLVLVAVVKHCWNVPLSSVEPGEPQVA